jgi:hypothetical protein
MLKVTTNCAAGIPPIVPNTSTASVTSSWKMLTTQMPPVRGPQQAPFPTMLPATTGKSYNAKVIISWTMQPIVLTLMPINMESMDAPWERSNNSSSSATRFAIDVANKASKGVGQGKTLTLSLHWHSSHKKDHPSVKPELTTQRFLLDLLFDAVDGNTCQIEMVTFSCFTKHKRGDHIYRAHPDYCKGGPWYDWAYVEFGPDDTGNESHLYPAQIWFLSIF